VRAGRGGRGPPSPPQRRGEADAQTPLAETVWDHPQDERRRQEPRTWLSRPARPRLRPRRRPEQGHGAWVRDNAAGDPAPAPRLPAPQAPRDPSKRCTPGTTQTLPLPSNFGTATSGSAAGSSSSSSSSLSSSSSSKAAGPRSEPSPQDQRPSSSPCSGIPLASGSGSRRMPRGCLRWHRVAVDWASSFRKASSSSSFSMMSFLAAATSFCVPESWMTRTGASPASASRSQSTVAPELRQMPRTVSPPRPAGDRALGNRGRAGSGPEPASVPQGT